MRLEMHVDSIDRAASEYPAVLNGRIGRDAPLKLFTVGDLSILGAQRQVGLICSVQCPGGVVIRTFDAVRELRDAGVMLVGGFHSPMERECLEFLFRGTMPVIVCPARGLAGYRMPDGWAEKVAAGKLLLLSSFGDEVTRMNEAQAEQRNDLVAALADAVLVPHASPGGKAEATVRRAIERGQTVYTFDDEENAHLFALGARRYDSGEVIAGLRG